MIPNEILDFLEEHQPNPTEISIADIDELLMTIEAYPGDIPKRFIDVAKEFAKSFRQMGQHQQAETLFRLVRIAEVDARLPRPVKLPDLNDDLVPTFILKSKDKERVLILCTQMRKIIFATEVFDQPHKRRLLNRIAGIENQVEQPKGMLDVIRGGVSDIGEALGKFGGDIKPLTDRISEVLQITRANSKEYDQLPPPEEIKQLPKPEESTEK